MVLLAYYVLCSPASLNEISKRITGSAVFVTEWNVSSWKISFLAGFEELNFALQAFVRWWIRSG